MHKNEFKSPNLRGNSCVTIFQILNLFQLHESTKYKLDDEAMGSTLFRTEAGLL